MNLLGYWDVLRGQKRVVIIGLVVTLALSALALLRVSPDGVSLRSPRVYVAKATMFVTQGQARPGEPSPPGAEYQAQIFAQLAYSDSVRLLIDPTLKRQIEYSVDSITGQLGTPLPLISVSALATTPAGAVALANRVSESLQKYIGETQVKAKVPKSQRASMAIIARPDDPTDAEVFRGIRLTPPLMLFVLGFTATVFLAFTRHNLRLGRQGGAQAAQPSEAQPESLASGQPSLPVQALERRATAGERWKSPRTRRSSS